MDQDIETVLFTREQIQKRISELAAEISQDYKDKNPIVICVLRGAVLFFADLTSQMDILMEMEFMSVSSYGNGYESTGCLKIKKDIEIDVTGRHLLIVEDIIDTGLTLSELVKNMAARNPASIKICTLLDKECKRKFPVEIGYTGFKIDDVFILGYGLDFHGQYRNLPYIGLMKPSKIAEIEAREKKE